MAKDRFAADQPSWGFDDQSIPPTFMIALPVRMFDKVSDPSPVDGALLPTAPERTFHGRRCYLNVFAVEHLAHHMGEFR
jgi:hypothetical protein